MGAAPVMRASHPGSSGDCSLRCHRKAGMVLSCLRNCMVTGMREGVALSHSPYFISLLFLLLFIILPKQGLNLLVPGALGRHEQAPLRDSP